MAETEPGRKRSARAKQVKGKGKGNGSSVDPCSPGTSTGGGGNGGTHVDDIKALYLAEFRLFACRLESQVVKTYVGDPRGTLDQLRCFFEETLERLESIRGTSVPCPRCPGGWIECKNCRCCPPLDVHQV
jgi:hypothetical protein